MVAIATKSRHLALLCELDISDCLLACTVISFQSLLYIKFYMKLGVKGIIRSRVLIKGKHRTSIEHVRVHKLSIIPGYTKGLCLTMKNGCDGIDGVTFLETLGEGMIE